MPGMAANPSIFEKIQLPVNVYEMHLLQWAIPEKGESLKAYALHMCDEIIHKDPILIGVSFGGILVQEMAKHIITKKIIIISSVKTRYELPKRMIFARYTKVHKLLPTGLVNNIELLAKYAFGESVNKRLSLYEKYLSVRDKYYIDWSIDQIVHWQQEQPIPGIVHIHGEKDGVFPTVYLKEYIEVKGGTHIMIINKYKWFNENLPKLLAE
ncbi:alpha/beta hydrolase [Leptobacterium sp. I13]|uniref:alpha/beta hydrolase n=1 Tax=Leptobacterium meishanense TaxID=3128904 RepID=UPI0030EE0153